MKYSGKWGVGGVTFALGAAVIVTPGTAKAWDCASTASAFEPAGRVDVPTDTLIWGTPASVTRLLGPTGEAVALEQRDLPVDAGGVPVLAPSALLEPNARYMLEINRGNERRPHIEVFEFQTGAGPTSAPPERPVLLHSEPSVAGGAGVGAPVRTVKLDLEHQGILIGSTRDLPIESVDDLLIEPPPPRQALTAERDTESSSAPLEWMTTATTFAVGFGGCATWPEAGDEATGRFGVLDLAGNFSGWVEVPLVLPSREEAVAQFEADKQAISSLNVQTGRPSACSVQPGPTGGSGVGVVALTLGVALAAMRRASAKRAR